MFLGDLLADPRKGRVVMALLAVALAVYAAHYASLYAGIEARRDAVVVRVGWTGRLAEFSAVDDEAWHRSAEVATGMARLADEIEAASSIPELSRTTDTAAVTALREASRQAAGGNRDGARTSVATAATGVRAGNAVLSEEIGALVSRTRTAAFGGIAFGAVGLVAVAMLLRSLGDAQRWRQRWQRSSRAAHEGLWDWDIEAGRVDFSEACLEANGLRVGDGLEAWFARVHPDDAAAVRAALDAHLAGHTPVFEAEYRGADGFGGWRWMFARGVADRDPEGRPRHVACWQTDMSARREAAAVRAANETAQRAQNELRALLDALPDCVIVRAAGEVAYANAAARAAFGDSADLAQVAVRLRAAAGTNAPVSVTTRAGLDATWEVAAPVALRWDDIPAEVVVARDLSARVRMEGQLRTAERVVALGGLAAGLAHEINNPLTYVIGNLELAQQGVGDVAERVSRALGGAVRVRQVVAQLRAMANPAAGELRSTPIDPSIDGALTLAGGIGLPPAKVYRDVPAEAYVMANPVWLGQILVNLVNNALQAMAPMPPESRGLAFRAFVAGDGTVALEVEDRGPGIPAHLLARVFEPFTSSRLQTGGSGLGLYICRELAGRMGGSLSLLRSGPGGTCFRLSLRAGTPTEAQVDEGADDALPVAMPVRRGRVLVVDDEAGLGELMKSYLSHHDVRVETTGRGGARALAEGNWDAVVLDIVLPDRSGIDLWRELRASDPAAAERVCFVTGGSLAPDVASFLVECNNPSLVKPFDFRELVSRVDAIVNVGPRSEVATA